MKHKLTYLIALFLIVAAFSCTQTQQKETANANPSFTDLKGQSGVEDDLSAKNILQVAIGSKDHTTLVAAVQATQLENVLVNAGPLTVFAPTNEAFDALPEGVLDDLLKPENKATLARIIKFHASPGKYDAEQLKDGMRLFQASGHYVDVSNTADGITVHGAKIIGTVEASNGIVHVVDKVMLPPEN